MPCKKDSTRPQETIRWPGQPGIYGIRYVDASGKDTEEEALPPADSTPSHRNPWFKVEMAIQTSFRRDKQFKPPWDRVHVDGSPCRPPVVASGGSGSSGNGIKGPAPRAPLP